MVYVFLVDAGIMMTFDVSYTLESVSHLAQAIERECHIPVEKQVLIVSGGESLDPNRRVCLYSAGTDTNPFFLFRRIDYECGPPNYEVEAGRDVDMQGEVDRALQLRDSYETVEHRAQLAKSFCELAIEQTNICKQLVHEQHLQQQGWAASLANMDDCVNVVQHNLEHVKGTVQKHVSKINHYKNLLASFNEVLDKLSQVPLPQALLVGGGAFMEDLISSLRSAGKGNAIDEKTEDANSTEETKEESSVQGDERRDEQACEEPMVVSNKSGSNNSLGEDIEGKRELEASLLQWIHHHDEKGTMKMLVDNCERGLRQFGEALLEELNGERERLLADLHIPNVKEIKGLEERLCTLEQFMHQAKNLVQSQSELSQSFSQNQHRCNHLGDPSILPDLCLLHGRQLAVMLENHCKIQDIRRRCNNAKMELCTSLFHRLKWIVYVESRIAQLLYKLNIMNEGLKRLDLNLELLSELHAAPQKYLMAVGEVVRRRTFSSAFLRWGQNLSSQLQSVYNEEIARRKEFDNNFEDHFVRLMFPGLDDCPIPFATEAPRPFDADLPKLSLSDLEMIRSKLPDVAKVVPAPEISDTMSHLMRVVLTCGEPPDKVKPQECENQHRGDAETDPETGVQPLKMRRIVPTLSSVPQLKDDRGFESETDTEEFEKVGQSPVDLVFEDRQPRASPGAAGNTVEVGVQCHGRQDVAVQCSQQCFRARSRSAMLACAGSSLDAGVQCRSMDSSFSLCEDTPRGSFVETAVQVVRDPSTPSTDSGIQSDALRASAGLNRSVAAPITWSCPAVLSTHCDAGIQCGEAFAFGFSSPSEPASTHSNFRSDSSVSVENSIDKPDVLASLSKDMEDGRKSEAVQGLAPVLMEDPRHHMCQLREAATALTRLLRADLAELRELVGQECKAVPTMLNEFRASWELVQAFFNDLPSQLLKSTQTVVDTSIATAGSSASAEKDTRISDLEKIVEQLNERERAIRGELLRKNAADEKDPDYQTASSELDRWLALVKKFKDEDNGHKDSPAQAQAQAQLSGPESYQDQVRRLTEEKKLLADLAVRTIMSQVALAPQLQKLNQSLAEAEERKHVALKEQAAKLHREHRADVANMRSRFRLMTSASMERSPSESSLEAEKVDVSDMAKDSIVAQITDKMSKERDAKIREAITATKKDMETEMKSKIKSMQMKMEAEKQVWFTDTMRRVMTGKEQQITSLMEREAQLKAECNKLRKTIHTMADPDSQFVGEPTSPLISKVRTVDIPSLLSLDAYPATSAEAEKLQKNLTRSNYALMQQGSVNVSSCRPGDIVLIVWDEAHCNYRIVQQKKKLFFVDHESLPTLGLSTTTKGVPLVRSCLAAVLRKYYCLAKKTENRFHVDVGTEFYQVKLAPIQPDGVSTTSSEYDSEASVGRLETSQTHSSELGLSILGSGPPSAVSDEDSAQSTAEMTS